MSFELIKPIIRHALTGLAGVLVSKGYIDGEAADGLAGAFTLIISIGWMIWEKRQAKKETK